MTSHIRARAHAAALTALIAVGVASFAQADADAARHQSRAADTDVIARVKTVYAESSAAHQAIDLSMGPKRRADESLALLRLRYGATAVDQQEVVKAEIEAATSETDVVRRPAAQSREFQRSGRGGGRKKPRSIMCGAESFVSRMLGHLSMRVMRLLRIDVAI